MLVRFLFCGLKTLTDKRWIAEDVAAKFRQQNLPPINTKGVSANDGGSFLERKAYKVLPECFGQPNVHLVVHQPHRNLGDASGPFTDLDAVECIYVHE